MLRRCLCVAAIALGCSGSERPPVYDGSVVIDVPGDHATADAARDVATARDAVDASVTDAPDVMNTAVDVVDASVTDAPDVTDAPVTDAPVIDVTDVTALDAPDVVDAPAAPIDAPRDAAASVDVDDAGFGAWTPIAGGERCSARERRVPTQASPHVEPDAGPIVWITNPPASGPHFGSWARFGAFPDVPRGNWVHSLEHGGVAFLYRCAGDAGACTDARDALVAAVATIPGDPACDPDGGTPRVRAVITNDREIETPVAGAAWGWLYAADCVEPTSVRAFFTRHVGMAPEDFCFDGTVP